MIVHFIFFLNYYIVIPFILQYILKIDVKYCSTVILVTIWLLIMYDMQENMQRYKRKADIRRYQLRLFYTGYILLSLSAMVGSIFVC